MQSNKPTFQDFLQFFEEVIPPIVITEDTIENIKDIAKPLPQIILDEYVTRWEGELDEFTEVIPCFSLPETKEYRAIVYWKASLLKYEYIILTFDKTDTLISKKTMCGTLVEGNIIKKSVAKIDEDLIIHIQAGATYENSDFDPDSSQSFTIELLESGDLLFNIDEPN